MSTSLVFFFVSSINLAGLGPPAVVAARPVPAVPRQGQGRAARPVDDGPQQGAPLVAGPRRSPSKEAHGRVAARRTTSSGSL